jgi:hypothetical protein
MVRLSGLPAFVAAQVPAQNWLHVQFASSAAAECASASARANRPRTFLSGLIPDLVDLCLCGWSDDGARAEKRSRALRTSTIVVGTSTVMRGTSRRDHHRVGRRIVALDLSDCECRFGALPPARRWNRIGGAASLCRAPAALPFGARMLPTVAVANDGARALLLLTLAAAVHSGAFATRTMLRCTTTGAPSRRNNRGGLRCPQATPFWPEPRWRRGTASLRASGIYLTRTLSRLLVAAQMTRIPARTPRMASFARDHRAASMGPASS